MATRIQVRRDTAANWATENPTLSSGEFGFETDTNKLKCGDGSTAWASLDYLSGYVQIDADGTLSFDATSSVKLPSGTTAQRPTSPQAGDLRWNTTDGSAEIYDGTEWGAVGGGGASETGFVAHAHTITTAQEIETGYNAVSGGPITIDTGGSVTLATDSVWTIV